MFGRSVARSVLVSSLLIGTAAISAAAPVEASSSPPPWEVPATSSSSAVKLLTAPPASVRVQTASDASGLASNSKMFVFQDGPDWAIEDNRADTAEANPSGLIDFAEHPIAIDAKAAGTYHHLPSPRPAVLPSSADTVRSYLIHAQRPRGTHGSVTLQGTIHFSTPIVGVIATAPRLNASDFLGETTHYPDRDAATTSNRGLELNDGDWFKVSGSLTTLTVHLKVNDSLDQIRVLTTGLYCDVLGTNGSDNVYFDSDDPPPDHHILEAPDDGQRHVVCGLAGADVMWGGWDNANQVDYDQVDILLGGTGSDNIQGFGGNDQIYGGPESEIAAERDDGWGDSNLAGGAGDDFIDGGAGPGTDSFAAETMNQGAETPIFVDFTNHIAEGYTTRSDSGCTVSGLKRHPQFGRDTLTNVEEVWGTNLNDVLIGNGVRNLMYGRGGKDHICGMGGNDALSGDDPYHFDCLNDPDQVECSPEAYPNGSDSLYGGTGDDALFGGLGKDLLDGGPGEDVAAYNDSDDPLHRSVTVDLSTSPVTCACHGNDTLGSIEDVTGSLWDDHLTGDSGDNVLDGNNGDDVIVGNGGDDVLIAGDGADTLNGKSGNDLLIANDDDTVVDTVDGDTGMFDECDVYDNDAPSNCDIINTTSATAATDAAMAETFVSPAAQHHRLTLGDVSWSGNDQPDDQQYRRIDIYVDRTVTKVIPSWQLDSDSAQRAICAPFDLLAARKPGYSLGVAAASACRNPAVQIHWSDNEKVFARAKGQGACTLIQWIHGVVHFIPKDNLHCQN